MSAVCPTSEEHQEREGADSWFHEELQEGQDVAFSDGLIDWICLSTEGLVPLK